MLSSITKALLSYQVANPETNLVTVTIKMAVNITVTNAKGVTTTAFFILPGLKSYQFKSETFKDAVGGEIPDFTKPGVEELDKAG